MVGGCGDSGGCECVSDLEGKGDGVIAVGEVVDGVLHLLHATWMTIILP